VGTKVFVIGHPVRLGWTVTQGIVSGLRGAGEVAPTALIQTDAAISPGNSGGPLLDEHGHLVGIVRSKLVGPGIENVSFAVPASAVRLFLQRVPARIPAASNAAGRSPRRLAWASGDKVRAAP
jgi:S1-C subfamily serine protease